MLSICQGLPQKREEGKGKANIYTQACINYLNINLKKIILEPKVKTFHSYTLRFQPARVWEQDRDVKWANVLQVLSTRNQSMRQDSQDEGNCTKEQTKVGRKTFISRCNLYAGSLAPLLWVCASCLEPCLEGRIFSTNECSTNRWRKKTWTDKQMERWAEEGWGPIMRMLLRRKLFSSMALAQVY